MCHLVPHWVFGCDLGVMVSSVSISQDILYPGLYSIVLASVYAYSGYPLPRYLCETLNI